MLVARVVDPEMSNVLGSLCTAGDEALTQLVRLKMDSLEVLKVVLDQKGSHRPTTRGEGDVTASE